MSNETPVERFKITRQKPQERWDDTHFENVEVVKSEDYDKLKAERDEARAALAEERKSANALAMGKIHTLDRIETENASLRAELEKAKAEIKKLELPRKIHETLKAHPKHRGNEK
jgi:multidrug resistance efflux pump